MENSCRKKHKPSPKKWILASRYPEFRRNPALIPANAGLFHYAGNCPVRYIDPDGRKIVIDKSYGEDFENDVKESLKYLMKSERGKMIIKKLQESPHQFTIKKCNWLNFDDTSMCVDGDTIYWSPKHTLEASNGEYNSPAIILIHELTHAWVKKTDTGRKAYNNFYNTNKEKLNKLGYDKPTEEFATAIELVVAKELHEPSGRKFYNDVQRVDGYVVIVTLPKNMPLAHSQYWSK